MKITQIPIIEKCKCGHFKSQHSSNGCFHTDALKKKICSCKKFKLQIEKIEENKNKYCLCGNVLISDNEMRMGFCKECI